MTAAVKLALITATFAIGFFISGCTKQTAQVPQNAIQITFENGTYSPNVITIKLNQTITFINQSATDIWPASNIHPTHGIYPEFDPKKPVKQGNSWSFTFTKVGTWRFHDHLQPQITGTIIVE